MEELKAEATGLGLDFKGMKSKKEVHQLIEDFYESQAADGLVKSIEDVDALEESATEAEDIGDIVAAEPTTVVAKVEKKVEAKRKLSPREFMSQLARENKAKAMKTRVVRLTNNDKRESHVTTTAYLSCENQFFGLSKIVPLDTPIELEQCLIDVAKDVTIMLHVDEVDDKGRRTGNQTHKPVKKFVISYEDSTTL